jgi:hypothetical protein
MPAAVFRPEHRAAAVISAPPSDSPRPFSPQLLEAEPAPVDTEVSLWYELHRAGACLGEPIELDREPGGRFCVRGLVRSPERRAALEAAVTRAVPPHGVAVDIRTFQEAAASSPAPPAEPQPPMRALRRPIEDELVRYFGSHGSTGSAAMRATDFANESILSSQRALAEAWALRRLLNRFPASIQALLDGRCHALVDTMIRDHLAALRTSLREGRVLLEPVLRSIAPRAFEADVPEPRGESFDRLFGSVQRIDGIVRDLLAGEPSDSAAQRPAPVDSILELGREVATLELTLRALESDRSAVPSGLSRRHQ